MSVVLLLKHNKTTQLSDMNNTIIVEIHLNHDTQEKIKSKIGVNISLITIDIRSSDPETTFKTFLWRQRSWLSIVKLLLIIK